jgi:PHD/YefM family antitoxin component YafN of YafNO toxin-antitoxin module
MKVVTLREVKNNFTSFIVESKKEPIFITRNGKITAVLEYITDKDVEDFLLERSKKFHNMLNRVRKQKGGMNLKEYRASRNI